LFGDKLRARELAQAAGVPVVPGTQEPVPDVAHALAFARAAGYPVIVKATAGGGGRGMRVAENDAELAEGLAVARREAGASFGQNTVYLEKYVRNPRHIEVQILGDASGRVVHLWERDCSVQRRHQKMVEVAPAVGLHPELRAKICGSAESLMEGTGYRGAGTVEFLYADGDFFFLEMNTRIQVEHPVTELITGIDLVQWQIRVASGEPLPWTQDDIRFTGHAVECRITSEDPDSGFLPSAGRITHLEVPTGPGVRWDGAIAAGYEVSLFYDPLLGKLIVHAPDRIQAIDRMRRALDELRIVGVETSTPFHRAVMMEPDFRAGTIDIRYLERHPDILAANGDGDADAVAALAAALLEEERRGLRAPARVTARQSGRGGWRDCGWRR
jgi:acetyl-CoA carboxylase biotin carboxylase subunit